MLESLSKHSELLHLSSLWMS